MSLFLKLFNTTAEYNAYTADTANFILPNVSCTLDDLTTVHYNPWVETRVVAKYNVTSTSSPTQLCNDVSLLSAIEIDGVVQPSVVSAYTFSTTDEHTVKYALTDPTSIGTLFSYCSSLTSIEIPSSVTSIGNYAFDVCESLTSCTIGSGVTSIGDFAFDGCRSLTSIDIPNSVTSISSYAFYYCTSLTSVTIPNSVTSIGYGAFAWCTSFTSISIPSSVTSIGEVAFNNCRSLTSVTVNATTPPTLGGEAFSANASGRKIYVPSASVNAYKTATNWSDYASDIEPIS